MAFTCSTFDRRLVAFERAEAGRDGRPLSDSPFALVALSRRLDRPRRLDRRDVTGPDPVRQSSGPPLMFSH